ncbi:hypothetical protein SAMN05421866_2907 [Chryseobacterium oranimense]|uniref:Uncharacterized protein n=2 Tax=Chryseobacterium oranimense TaxID=421058 RepID=A0A1M5TBF0_9FLAO|nr:hypothetical protein SAMN05421866_2907 [Chryseobacterium oranimense]
MNKETANYIRNYFSNLMTDDEKLALKYHMYTYKTESNPKMRKMMVDKGWISEQPNIKEFLKDGYEEFELNVAKRIMNEVPEKVFLNNCPKCNKLARTPFARQCRYCGNNWHSLTVAQFKLENSVQITGRPFFLLGQITKGEIKQGQFMDLTILGINKKPKIEAIEFALKRQDGRVWEDIGLGTNELTEEEKEFIKNKGSFRIPFDIINER